MIAAPRRETIFETMGRGRQREIERGRGRLSSATPLPWLGCTLPEPEPEPTCAGIVSEAQGKQLVGPLLELIEPLVS